MYNFRVGDEGPVSTPVANNHASALQHPHDVVAYVTKELKDGAILSKYDELQFIPWYQVNALLTRQKKDSHLHRVIMV